MNCGIYINGERPKSKKAVKEAIATDPQSVTLDITEFMKEQTLSLEAVKVNHDYYFVGPDPYNSRKFYGTIRADSDGKVVVK